MPGSRCSWQNEEHAITGIRTSRMPIDQSEHRTTEQLIRGVTADRAAWRVGADVVGG